MLLPPIPDIRTDSARCSEGVPSIGKMQALRFLVRSLVPGVVGHIFTDHKNIKHMLTNVRTYLFCLSYALGEALRCGWRSFGLGGQGLL